MDPKTLIDGHVHQRLGLQPGRLLDAAAANFALASGGRPWRGMLWLLEAKGSRQFHELWRIAGEGRGPDLGWRLTRPVGEDISVRAEHPVSGARIDIVAGCQVATVERLEICIAGSLGVVPDGLSLDDSVERCLALDGLVFLPWGAGKWTGARGAAVQRLLAAGRHAGRIFAADNGGRPTFWGRPALFGALEAAGGRVLAGSDPLPIAGDERRVGSFGFRVDGVLDEGRPGRDLLARLSAGSSIEPFGSPLPALDFVKSQLALRFGPGKA